MSTPLSLESNTVNGRSLRVVFEQLDQKWLHRVALVSSQGEQALLNSVAHDEPAAASPALQDGSREELPEGPALMFVGMSNNTHWSLSVSRTPDGDGLSFDVAARGSETDRYGSSVTCAPCSLTETDPPRVSWGNEVALQVTVQGPAASQLLAFPKQQLRVAPAAPATDDTAKPQTCRWQYRISLIHPGEDVQASGDA